VKIPRLFVLEQANDLGTAAVTEGQDFDHETLLVEFCLKLAGKTANGTKPGKPLGGHEGKAVFTVLPEELSSNVFHSSTFRSRT